MDAGFIYRGHHRAVGRVLAGLLRILAGDGTLARRRRASASVEEKGKMFRILSIDGGGIKGVFPAAFLTGLQRRLALPIANYFDLISGTSTGGIIALGLGLGLEPAEILHFYKSSGTNIFPGSQRWVNRARRYFFTKYSADPLRRALEVAFGGKLLGHSQKRLVIPSFSALTGRTCTYKTPHHPRFESDWSKTAIEVAMATSAAPTYFPPYVTRNFIPHLDGGMWANNPTGIAAVEAVGILGIDFSTIRILSLGCTCTPQSFDLKEAGLWGWRTKALEASFSGQSFGAMGVAGALVGRSNIQRVDPIVQEGRFSLDNPELVNELDGRATECAKEELPKFRELFDHGEAEQFKPLYGPLSEGSLSDAVSP
jgi:predicted acylesterase/phospholipase RssA